MNRLTLSQRLSLVFCALLLVCCGALAWMQMRSTRMHEQETVQRLSRGLVRRGHHVTVIHDVDAFNALHRGPEPREQPEPEGLEVVRLRSGMGKLSPLLTHQTGMPVFNGRRIRKILDEGNFDVVNFHNVSLVGGPGLLSYGGDAVKLYMAHEHWLVCPMHVLWRYGRELRSEQIDLTADPLPHARLELRRRRHRGEFLAQRLQHIVHGFLTHRSNSCSFCRASKRRDFTVPSGAPTISATSRMLCSSIDASTTTIRKRSGSASIAAQRRSFRSSARRSPSWLGE